MLIPIGTDVHHKRNPTVTYLFIGLNLLVFALQWSLERSGGLDSNSETTRAIAGALADAKLSQGNFHFYALVTYQFLHGSWMHILGNMVFLLPFGKTVEDRMGHIGFAMFYLGCGAFGGGMHTLLSSSPVIGASGSVCAVTAAFIVLAPKTNIKVLLIFFIIGIYQIPSMLLVLFFVLFDVFSLLASFAGANSQPTAWVVHLGGYASGFVVTFALLGLGIIASTEFDLTQVFKQAKRRREFKQVIAQAQPNRIHKEKEVTPLELIRARLSDFVAQGNDLSAADFYLDELKLHPKLKLNQQTHAAIAKALMLDGRIEDGVEVYEKYLTEHKNANDRGEVALLLTAKYVRILKNYKRAKELLKQFNSEFSDKHKHFITTLENEIQHDSLST
ncbi:MAG TPA: rhomboid family intramembrane serine protease [Phycisphaerales bacterium]|nr:rhomboid family intramembrane serine protease [Phycisphaerales bacterium]HIO20171.1 rhomboid family intramembrane serine protease [Phycisphaerales bacterium]